MEQTTVLLGQTWANERSPRAEQLEHQVQMLLGVFDVQSLSPLEFKLAYSVGDLLQHLAALEQEAEEKGGVQQMLADHFAKAYKVKLPLVA